MTAAVNRATPRRRPIRPADPAGTRPSNDVRSRRGTGPRVLAALVVATQIAYPLTHGEPRDGLTIASVLAFSAASVAHAARSRGGRWALGLLAVAAGGGLLAEAVGVHTGVPFGSYAYSSSLGPRLFAVPLVVPLAWVMMAYPALLAGRWAGPARWAGLTRQAGPAGRATTALTGGGILATWDLFLDPQMVDAGHWRWAAGPPGERGWLGTTLNGIPLSNLVGWLVVGTVLVAALDALPDPTRPQRAGATRPTGATSPADDRLPIVLLGWTYASSVLANLAFFGRPTVALVGGLAMGAVLAFAFIDPVRVRTSGRRRPVIDR